MTAISKAAGAGRALNSAGLLLMSYGLYDIVRTMTDGHTQEMLFSDTTIPLGVLVYYASKTLEPAAAWVSQKMISPRREGKTAKDQLRMLRNSVTIGDEEAFAKALDGRDGLYLIKHEGTARFKIVTKKEFMLFSAELAADGKPLLLLDAGGASGGLRLRRIVGGFVDGVAPGHPGIIEATAAGIRLRSFRQGEEICRDINELPATAFAL